MGGARVGHSWRRELAPEVHVGCQIHHTPTLGLVDNFDHVFIRSSPSELNLVEKKDKMEQMDKKEQVDKNRTD